MVKEQDDIEGGSEREEENKQLRKVVDKKKKSFEHKAEEIE